MTDEEILKYAKIFSNAKGDTYKINFVSEDKTIDEVAVWKGVLNLIDKKQKVIDLMIKELSLPGKSSAIIELYSNVAPGKPIYDLVKEYFYKKAEE